MATKLKFFLKSLLITVLFDFLAILLFYILSIFMNDFLMRSLTALSIIIIPFYVNYKMFWTKIIELSNFKNKK